MTEPIQPRRKVTGLIPTTSSPAPSPSSSAPTRVRAKVDPSSIASSASPSASASARPSLRSTPSTASIRSHVTTPITSTRARPPARPLPHHSSSYSSTRTPQAHVTVPSRTSTLPTPTSGPSRSTPGSRDAISTPVARVRASRTVIGSSGSPVTPASARRVAETAEEAVKVRARALSLRNADGDKASPIGLSRPSASTSASTPLPPLPPPPLPITPVVASRAQPHLLSPHIPYDHQPGSPLGPSWRPHASPEIIDDYPEAGPSSARSASPHRAPHLPTNAYAQHALANILQHPSASAPSSPVHHSRAFPPRSPPRSASREQIIIRGRPKLPYNPHSNNPPPLPAPPHSPELKPVALPSVTPARTSEESSQTGSSIREYGGSGSGSELSGGGSGSADHNAKAGDARVERDRLSGATAVEVNDTVEGEKDGQVDVVLGEDEEEAKINRKVADLEISNASLMAINRTLEATKAKQRSEILKLRRMLRESIGGVLPQHYLPTSSSTQSLVSPLGLFSPNLNLDDQSTDGYMDEEMADEQLDARWDKVTELVGAMRRRGELAVERGNEEVKAGPQRVLGWHEVEDGEGEGNAEGVGDQSVEMETPPND